ncbi:MAG: GTP-binding protein, partial [Chlorobi bacterium]|nr:GTP-binding protein [Chlorobiota bacterium]
MKTYETAQLRNIALVGQAAAGKTTFSESIHFVAGTINRRGTVEEHSTVSDFNDIEHERHHSVIATPMFAEYKNTKINFIDTPGYNDYCGEVVASMAVVDTAVIFLNAQHGIEVGAENAAEEAAKKGKPVVFAINKLDLDNLDFDSLTQELKDAYGSSVTVLQFPVKTGNGITSVVDILSKSLLVFDEDGKMTKADIPAEAVDKAEELRNEFVESIAESDEDLMNKYFDEGDLTDEDIKAGMKKGIAGRMMFPVFCLNSKTNLGTKSFLDFVVDYLPSPADMPGLLNVEDEVVAFDPSAHSALLAFKMISEARLGDLTYFKVG